MSESEPGFAFVRKAEVDALKRIKQPSAAKVWIAIRVMVKGERQDHAIGSRDFADWGVSRDAAAAALKAFVAEGMLTVSKAGAFGRRGDRTLYRIVHRREASAENTAGKTVNSNHNTAGKTDTTGRKNRQLPEITAGFSDTPKEPSPPSATKAKEEKAAPAAPPDEGRKRLRESLDRIDEAAKAVAMTKMPFICKAGGPSAADFLARAFASGNLNALQLAARLAEGSAGLGNGAAARASPNTTTERVEAA